MPGIDPTALGITFAATIIGLGVVIILARRPRRQPDGVEEDSAVPANATEMDCSVCGRALIFESHELTQLSPTEMALVVRVKPETVGRALSEYTCPHCDAAHCFAVDGPGPEWIGENLYEPQHGGGRCLECRKSLTIPPWTRGAHDERLSDVPDLRPDYGLTCPRCESVCCVECVDRASRGRTETGELVCPRCSRPPMNHFFHG
jgi:hypothetical protein